MLRTPKANQAPNGGGMLEALETAGARMLKVDLSLCSSDRLVQPGLAKDHGRYYGAL